MTTTEEIKKLELRRSTAEYQRRITTCIGTAIEYDQEIASINRRLDLLRHRLADKVIPYANEVSINKGIEL